MIEDNVNISVGLKVRLMASCVLCGEYIDTELLQESIYGKCCDRCKDRVLVGGM